MPTDCIAVCLTWCNVRQSRFLKPIFQSHYGCSFAFFYVDRKKKNMCIQMMKPFCVVASLHVVCVLIALCHVLTVCVCVCLQREVRARWSPPTDAVTRIALRSVPRQSSAPVYRGKLPGRHATNPPVWMVSQPECFNIVYLLLEALVNPYLSETRCTQPLTLKIMSRLHPICPHSVADLVQLLFAIITIFPQPCLYHSCKAYILLKERV